MRFSHILTQHQYEIEDILKQMEGGKAFEKMAEKFSLCPSAAKGGDLGEVALNRFVSEFSEVAETLKIGETSKPVKTRFGYHLILRTS